MLHGVSFAVPAGRTIALVGHTGAGKSTIVKLLARFYDPTGGRITSTGTTCATSPSRRFAGSSGSCRRRGSSSPARCARTSRSAGPTRPTTRSGPRRWRSAPTSSSRPCPDGYDTDVQERGSRLSIGQRQLVAFARALLADPRILILDEATSSVDIPTEARIEEALETLLRDRTAFVVAHRLSTIRRADMIVVLEHGEVIEAGTHSELIARRGRYFSLYDDWVEAVA